MSNEAHTNTPNQYSDGASVLQKTGVAVSLSEARQNNSNARLRVGSDRNTGYKASAKEHAHAWKSELILNSQDKPKAILANALLALRKAPEWHGKLRYNTFDNSTYLCGAPPWLQNRGVWKDRQWSDNDDRLLAVWLQNNGIFVNATVAGEAVESAARDNQFHPVRDYIKSCHWDGSDRLERILPKYFGTEDNSYTRAVGRKWMISAVARVFQPGCKADCMLILEGPQGIGKSTALNILGGSWYADRLSDLKSKDSMMELHGAWIVEISELDTLNRSESGTIKAFLSRTVDRYRPPYGKRLIDAPRQCIFAGTVNPEGGYLKDTTGARRFWPVECKKIDTEGLRLDRDQLWAEAYKLYKAGENWHLDTPELEALAWEHQSSRSNEDPWLKPISKYLQCNQDGQIDEITVNEILERVLFLEIGKWGQHEQTRVARCLMALGYKKIRVRTSTGRGYCYRREPVRSAEI